MAAPPSRSGLPRTMAGVALTVSLGLIGYAGWQAWSSSCEQGIEQRRLVRLGGLVGRASKLDRVADVAAHAGAVNADLQWTEQFDDAATEMVSALEQALLIALDSGMHASLVRMQSAGVAILTRARVALDLADQGRRHAARELLSAADHLEQQRIYRSECSWVESELGRASDGALNTGRAKTLAALTLGGGSVVLFLICLFLSRKLGPGERVGADPSADFTHTESRFDEPVLVETDSVAEPIAPLSEPLEEAASEPSEPGSEPELGEVLDAPQETPDDASPAETKQDETTDSPDPPEPVDADGSITEPVSASDDGPEPAPLRGDVTPPPRNEPTPVDFAELDDKIAASIDEQTILQEGAESGSEAPSARPHEAGDEPEPRAVESEGTVAEPTADEASEASADIDQVLPEQSIEAELADAEKALEEMESMHDAPEALPATVPESPEESAPERASEGPTAQEEPDEVTVASTSPPAAADDPETPPSQETPADTVETGGEPSVEDAAAPTATETTPTERDLGVAPEASISEEIPESAEETDDPPAAPEAVAEEQLDENESPMATEDSASDDAETPAPSEGSDSVPGADPSAEELGESLVDDLLDAAEARLEEAATSEAPA